jgi:hypothetical protein
MPTIKPRFTVTLTEQEIAVLDRFAAASGQPRATIAAELLSTAIPELEKAAELMEIAIAAPRKVRQRLVDDLANATADAMGMLEPYQAVYRRAISKAQGELPLDQPKRRKAPPKAAVRSPGGDTKAKGKPGKDPSLLTGGSK